MKYIIIFLVMVNFNAYSSESDCDGRFVNNRCLTVSPFEVSRTKYEQGFVKNYLYSETGEYLGINIQSFISPTIYSFARHGKIL